MSTVPQSSDGLTEGAIPAVWWQHLFVDSDDPQVVCDRDGVVCEVNRRAAQRFGLTTGHRLLQCPALAPGAAAQLRDALARGTDKTETLGTIGITCAEGTCLVADL